MFKQFQLEHFLVPVTQMNKLKLVDHFVMSYDKVYGAVAEFFASNEQMNEVTDLIAFEEKKSDDRQTSIDSIVLYIIRTKPIYADKSVDLMSNTRSKVNLLIEIDHLKTALSGCSEIT